MGDQYLKIGIKRNARNRWHNGFIQKISRNYETLWTTMYPLFGKLISIRYCCVTLLVCDEQTIDSRASTWRIWHSAKMATLTRLTASSTLAKKNFYLNQFGLFRSGVPPTNLNLWNLYILFFKIYRFWMMRSCLICRRKLKRKRIEGRCHLCQIGINCTIVHDFI